LFVRDARLHGHPARLIEYSTRFGREQVYRQMACWPVIQSSKVDCLKLKSGHFPVEERMGPESAAPSWRERSAGAAGVAFQPPSPTRSSVGAAVADLLTRTGGRWPVNRLLLVEAAAGRCGLDWTPEATKLLVEDMRFTEKRTMEDLNGRRLM
jgi:hypothetical protein